MSPAMVVDGKVHGRVKPGEVTQRLTPAQTTKATP
jgi:NADH:ubiquinone oxidoreductase subunit E